MRGREVVGLCLCALAVLVGGFDDAELFRTPGNCTKSGIPDAEVRTAIGGTQGYADGPPNNARFDAPAAVAAHDGVLYVADAANHRVRAVGVTGVVTTVAGTGSAGNEDGEAHLASFHTPTGLAVLNDGTIVVVDQGNHKLRHITNDERTVATFAGLGLSGFRDGAPTQAQFERPTAIAYDTALDVLYLTDTGNHLIRRVASEADAREVTTLAGVTHVRDKPCCFPGFVDGTLIQARFGSPNGIHLHAPSQTLYITDPENRAVRVLSLAANQVSSYTFTAPFSPPADYGGKLLPSDAVPYGNSSVTHLVVADVSGKRLWNASLASATPDPALAYVRILTAYAVSGASDSDAAHRDGVGEAAAFRSPTRLLPLESHETTFAETAVEHASDTWRLLVLDTEAHALRIVYAAEPYRLLRLRVEGQGTFDGAADSDGIFYKSTSTRHLDLDETGYYVLDGPPLNGTSEFHGHIRYHKESHVVTFCAAPRQAYFLTLAGPVVASLEGVDDGHTYLVWTGRTRLDRRDFAFMLRGPGCTSPAAANYNPFATSDDGTCVHPATVRLVVRQRGDACTYAVDGPDLFLTDALAPLATHVDPATGALRRNLDGSVTVHFDDEHDVVLPLFPAARYAFTFVGSCEARLETADGTNAPGGRGKVFWDVAPDYGAERSAWTSARVHKVFRTPGPGCTDPTSDSFDPAATSDDGSCRGRTPVAISLVARNWADPSAAPSAWYGLGAFVVAQAVADGALYVASPVRVTSTNESTTLALRLLPGSYELQYYGNLTGSVLIGEEDGATAVEVTPGLEGVLPAEELRIVAFEVPGLYDAAVSVDRDGGTVGEPGKGTLNVPPGALHASDDGTVRFRVSLWNDTSMDAHLARQRLLRLHITPHSALFSFAPHHFAFAQPVLLTVPYDAPYARASAAKSFVFMRASDATLHDLQAVPGGVFADDTAFLMTDRLGVYFVAAKPELWSVEGLSRVDARRTTLLRVFGAGLKSFGNAYCTFGNAFSRASFRGDLAQDGHVSCEMPAGQAGFVEVALVNTDLLLLSTGANPTFRSASPADSLLLEFATPAVLGGMHPREAGANGGAVLSVQGEHLHASRNVGGENVMCDFDGAAATMLIVHSSAMGRCVVPDARDVTRTHLQLLKPFSPALPTRAAVRIYDTMAAPPGLTNTTGMSTGGRIVRIIGPSAVASRCMFGPVHVRASPDPVQPSGLSCPSPALSPVRSVLLLVTQAPGEEHVKVGTYVPIAAQQSFAHVRLERHADADKASSARVSLDFAPLPPDAWEAFGALASTVFAGDATVNRAHLRPFAALHTGNLMQGMVAVRIGLREDEHHVVLSENAELPEFPAVASTYPRSLAIGGIVHVHGSNLHAAQACSVQMADADLSAAIIHVHSTSLAACELPPSVRGEASVAVGDTHLAYPSIFVESFELSIPADSTPRIWSSAGGEAIHASFDSIVSNEAPMLGFGPLLVVASAMDGTLVARTPARAPGRARVHTPATSRRVTGMSALSFVEDASGAMIRVLTPRVVPGTDAAFRVALRAASVPTRASLVHAALEVPRLDRGVDGSPDVVRSVPAPGSVGFAAVSTFAGRSGGAADDQVLFVAMPVLHTVLPLGVPRSPTVAMHVAGRNLYDNAACAFDGGHGGRARFVSSALITCAAPSLLTAGADGFAASITLGIVGDVPSATSLVLHTFPDVGDAVAAIPSAVPELDTSTVLPFRNDTYVAEMRSRGAAVTCHFGTRLVRALAVNGTHMVCPVPLHHEAPFRLTLGAFASSAAPRVVGGGEASGVAAL